LLFESLFTIATLLVERRLGFPLAIPGDGCILDPRFIEASREFTVVDWFYVMLRVAVFFVADYF